MSIGVLVNRGNIGLATCGNINGVRFSVPAESSAKRLTIASQHHACSCFATQARAQSATELSTSRRLKAELSRAFAAQQRHGARGTPTPADVVLSSHRVPLGQHGGGVVSDGGGDMGAGSSVGFGGSGFSGGANFDHAGARCRVHACSSSSFPREYRSTLHYILLRKPLPSSKYC